MKTYQKQQRSALEGRWIYQAHLSVFQPHEDERVFYVLHLRLPSMWSIVSDAANDGPELMMKRFVTAPYAKLIMM